MIPHNFDYYRPDTVAEAVDVFETESRAGKKAYYYGGGTEIITMARAGGVAPDAVIDIKHIPECTQLGTDGENLVLGAALTLTQIFESGVFPLLGLACARVADHSAQGKITLGGNVAGTIIYHEAVLPLLLSDCSVTIAGPSGTRDVPLMQAFCERMRLENGGLIVKFTIRRYFTKLPYVHVKKTSAEKIGYPLLTACALRMDEELRVAFSGVCAYPFRSPDIERILKNRQVPPETMADLCLQNLPAPVHDDITGKANYREFVFKETLVNLLGTLG